MGSVMTVAEAEKCFASGFKDCYGPNNDARKIVERTIVGPATDVLRGDIGRSDQSVWRKLGLPEVKLW
jgi:hypothetical protein